MRKTNALRCLAVTTALGFLVGSSGAASIQLPVSNDAHIDGVDQSANFGSATVLSIEQTAIGGNKAYLLFDASSMGATNVGRVENLRVVWSGSTSITRTLAIWLITGTDVDTWTESTLTWLNAPANNVTGTDRNFVVAGDQALTLVGYMQYSAGNPRELIIPLTEGSPVELALREALNTGDRKATIGINYNSSQSTAVGVYSKEYSNGINTPMLQIVEAAPPDVPATFLEEPRSVVVTNGPYKLAHFAADATGTPTITYQWFTNGVAVDGAIGKTLSLPAQTTELNGVLVSVRIDNDFTPDPGRMSSNALLTIVEPLVPDGVVTPTADVYITGTTAPTIYNSYTIGIGQINYGLAASSGASLDGPNRSYLAFQFGTNRVSEAKLRLYQYWGGPAVNGTGKLARGTIRVFGSTNTLNIVEPPVQTGQAWPDNPEYAPPSNTNFVQITPEPDQVVGPDIGWYEFDITWFYNANLGKQTVLRLGGVQTSGYDSPLFEDRENTASQLGAGGSWPNTGPRIEYFLAPPQIDSVEVSGNQLILKGSGGEASQTFYLLNSATLSGWTSIRTNQFDAGGNFTISIPYNAGVSRQFYRLQIIEP